MQTKHRLIAVVGAVVALPLFASCTPDEMAAWRASGQLASIDSESDPSGSTAPPVPLGSVWDDLAECEASGDWDIDTGNGYSGGLQFHPDTWDAYGGEEFADDAHEATRDEQIAVAERVQAEQGWGAWPSCTSRLGLR